MARTSSSQPSPGVIQYLKGAQWADRLPRIVQARLAETFQRSGNFGGVGKPGEGLAIDYQIIVEIRAFEVRVDGGERADVELFVRILNDRNGVVRASNTFTASAPVAGAGQRRLCRRLDGAFGEAAAEIVDWTEFPDLTVDQAIRQRTPFGVRGRRSAFRYP